MTRDEQRRKIVAAFRALPHDTWWDYDDLADVALNALGVEPLTPVQPRARGTIDTCPGPTPEPGHATTDATTAPPATPTCRPSAKPAQAAAPRECASCAPA